MRNHTVRAHVKLVIRFCAFTMYVLLVKASATYDGYDCFFFYY